MTGFFWFLWVLISIFVLGVFGWTTYISHRQKKTWEAFAKKHKLDFSITSLKYIDSSASHREIKTPYVTGRYKDYRIYLFTDVVRTADIRSERYLTAIEIELGQGLPVAAAIGNNGMRSFILGLKFSEEFSPADKSWETGYVLRTKNAAALKAYLTEERLKKLASLFTMNNASVLFFFDEVEGILRIETTDPLLEVKKIEGVLNRILGVMEKFKVDAKEAKLIQKAGKTSESFHIDQSKTDDNDDQSAASES